LDLYPRLRKLKYQKLFVPKGVTVPDTLLLSVATIFDGVALKIIDGSRHTQG
jgi:hypothetical protein